MSYLDPAESSLICPIIELYSGQGIAWRQEVPLGQRRIDMLGIGLPENGWIAIELKIRDWRGALAQAAINNQLVDKSYVAMWHKYIPNALNNISLFNHYNVGLIEISPYGTQIVRDCTTEELTNLKLHIRNSVARKFSAEQQVIRNETISFLST